LVANIIRMRIFDDGQNEPLSRGYGRGAISRKPIHLARQH
jgi:hypothetical protein